MPSETISVALTLSLSHSAYNTIRLSTHFTYFFDVKTQLSHRGDKLRLELINLRISEYVVDKAGDSRSSLGTHNTDTADERSVHGHFYKAEYMLYTTSSL